MSARRFWSAVWAEVNGTGERHRTAVAIRIAALNQLEAMIRTSCFTHNPKAEHGWMTCHCEVADEFRRMATTPKES